jgi:hypothetical protein
MYDSRTYDHQLVGKQHFNNRIMFAADSTAAAVTAAVLLLNSDIVLRFGNARIQLR